MHYFNPDIKSGLSIDLAENILQRYQSTEASPAHLTQWAEIHIEEKGVIYSIQKD